ncbi:hypothetical protein [Sphingomonas sp. S2-65]|uniref:hypothetical protein n=1 Tax=Sphingomonas sp. S2-65 TaxID=2903960 RepID=UPI001F2CC043|nr:hypothetical protein [Sphingomonas sp. S2-65]UYY57240.1 hypothetical protein LZ586_11130 [Sphingomonas sp. S2-65]
MTDDPQAFLDSLFTQAEANVAQLSKHLRQLQRKKSEVAERKWVTALTMGVERVRTQLAARKGTSDVVAALELSQALGDLYIRAVVDEIEAELNETPVESTALHEVLRKIERLSEEGQLLGDTLFRTSLDVTLSRQETEDMRSTEQPVTEIDATFVQTVVETLPSREFLADLMASINSSNAALVAPTQRPTGVGAQFSRTLDALDLPHTGSGLGFDTRKEEARRLLIDALKRGFAFRDHDGVRTYHRVDRLPVSTRPSSAAVAGPSLRGVGLFQAEMLRSQATLLLQLIDELPSMLNYTPLLASYNTEQLRDRIRVNLDDIVAIASAPLGPTPGQGEGRFRRLVLSVADWLERGGIARCERLRAAAALPRIEELLKSLDQSERCIVTGAAIPTVEVDLRIKALHEALKAIGTAIIADRTTDAGRAGAEVEQTLTLLGVSAAALRAELDRLGNSPEEQEVMYFGGHRHPEVSIAQFAGWVEDISAPFAAGDDKAPTLRREELAVLAIDLAELLRLSAALQRHSATYTAELRLIGARRQIKEIGYLLQRASDAVATMLQPAA